MVDMSSESEGRQAHWDDRYTTVGASAVSWYEPEPIGSLQLFDRVGVTSASSVIDVGGGASHFVDALLARGFRDLTVLDVSQVALDEARRRTGDRPEVAWVHADLLDWVPARRWAVWHDRAVFHFLTSPAERATYRNLVRQAVQSGGVIIVATFAPDGPERCSGLPVQRFSPEDLAVELGDGLELLAGTRSGHETPTGAIQPYSWVALRI